MAKHIGAAAAAIAIAWFLSGCGGSPAAPETTATTPTLTQTVTITPTPTAAATSGSYAADLAALGVVPDSITSFASFMEERICQQTGTDLGISVRSSGGNPTGGGVEGVRLTVAYFCPEKSAEVEHYLEYFN